MCETRIFMHTFNLNSISQMKKKIFSALLMGVFTLASMSMFVSCKDYDDDINNLDAGQQELLSRIEALEGEVNTNYTDLSGQLATAVENANKALQGSNDALAALEEVRTTASAAGTAAANAQTTADGAQEAAEDAQKTADDALEAAKKALEAIGVDESGVSLVEKVADLENRVASLEALKETIPTLIEQAQKATNEQLKALNEQVAKYEAFFDNLFAMLTGVELYGTYTGNAVSVLGENSFQAGDKLMLGMIHGRIGETSTFGDNEALLNDNKTVYDGAKISDPVTFTKGDDIKVNQGIVVRVNPVNANITDNNTAIKIINSKGEDMSDFIKVAGIKAWDKLITRAGKINTGLYELELEYVDGFDMDAFDKAVRNTDGDIMFAVAINNTDTINEDRYVASTFDLGMKRVKYENVKEFSYTVDGKSVDEIRNRWDTPSTPSATEEKLEGEALNAKEYRWMAKPATNYTAPATSMTVDKNAEVSVREDCRADNSFNYLAVSVGKPFTIELDDHDGKIAYYYVTLDYNFAGVSAPSELNAWESYSITGLNTMTKATDELSLTINDLKANADKGDKIGFRVFAVNQDGTLADPDGRAFYVAVGDEATANAVNVEILASGNGHGYAKFDTDFEPVASKDKVEATQSAGTALVAHEDFDKDKVYSTADGRIGYQIGTLSSTGVFTAVSDWKDANAINVWYNDVTDFVDNGTVSFTIEATANVEGAQRVVNVLTVNVTKVMPTVATLGYERRAGQVVDGTYTCYVDPNTNPAWEVTSVQKGGHRDLTELAHGVTAAGYEWTFANADLDSQNKVIDLEMTGSTTVDVATPFIDNETPHATTVDYNWGKISLTAVNEDPKDYVLPVDNFNTIFACALDPSVMKYGIGQYAEKVGNQTVMHDVNYIYYGTTQAAPEWLKTANLGSYLTAENAVSNSLFTKKSSVSGYQIWKGSTMYIDMKVELLSKENGLADYFTVTADDAANFTFTPIKTNEESNPAVDVPSILRITATDAFGHKNVHDLEFVVKRNPNM